MTKFKVGDKAPFFEGVDQNGQLHSLTSYAGKKLAVYFYPKDNTPGCTQQACSLRDHYHEIEQQGIHVLGVSMDSQASHLKFIGKYDLPFPLIADVDRKVIDAFDVWGPKKFMGKEYDGIHRTTFLIDENGVITAIFEKPKTKEHGLELLNSK
jgi:peroxiredoxin Q/BCP